MSGGGTREKGPPGERGKRRTGTGEGMNGAVPDYGCAGAVAHVLSGAPSALAQRDVGLQRSHTDEGPGRRPAAKYCIQDDLKKEETEMRAAVCQMTVDSFGLRPPRL